MLSLVGVGTIVTSASTGDMATVNGVTGRALLTFPAESVTVTVQSEYVPSGRVLKSILLLPTEDELSELLQLPPYVMSPASVELKMYLGVLSLVGVDTFVTLSSVGAVVSIINCTDRVP